MSERRAFPRYRTEVLVDFSSSQSRITGITYDVSLGGMFVRTARMPEEGKNLLAQCAFPTDGNCSSREK